MVHGRVPHMAHRQVRACSRSSAAAACGRRRRLRSRHQPARPSITPDDASSELGLRHDDLDRVGGGAEDATHLWNLLKRVEYVHRVAVLEKHEERVARTHSKGVRVAKSTRRSSLPERRTRQGPDASQNATPKRRWGLSRRAPRGRPRRLDEMGLADDDVHVIGLVDRHNVELHELLLRLGFSVAAAANQNERSSGGRTAATWQPPRVSTGGPRGESR